MRVLPFTRLNDYETDHYYPIVGPSDIFSFALVGDGRGHSSNKKICLFLVNVNDANIIGDCLEQVKEKKN